MQIFKCETIAQFKIGMWLADEGIVRDDILSAELVAPDTVKITNPAGQYMVIRWCGTMQKSRGDHDLLCRSHCRILSAGSLAVRSGGQNRERRPLMMARMRTAEGALEVIKEQDPNTAVTLRMIRRLINTGALPYVPVGRKKLINVDILMAYLEGKMEESA